jgi:hypothetical protein
VQLKYCGACGARRPTLAQEEQLRELEITLRQLERLYNSGVMTEPDFRVLQTRIVSEREQLLFPSGRPGAAKQPSQRTPEPVAQKQSAPPPVVEPTPSRSVTQPDAKSPSPEDESRPAGEWTYRQLRTFIRLHRVNPSPKYWLRSWSRATFAGARLSAGS